MVADEDTWNGLSAYGDNPGVRLGHELDQGTRGNGIALEMALFVSSVVAGVAIEDGDVRRETVVLSSLGPERLGIESRLDDPAPATFLGPADTILGDAVSLGHPRRGGRQPPMQC